MNTTAKMIADWARESIHDLAQRDGGYMRVYESLARVTGLSFSLVSQFNNGKKPNLTIKTLDRLVEGIRVVQEKRKV